MASPSTPSTPELAQLRAALAALAINSAPGRGLAQRHDERHALEAFLTRRLAACRPTAVPPEAATAATTTPGSIYICGPVGTGKTALVRDVVTALCSPSSSATATATATSTTATPAASTGERPAKRMRLAEPEDTELDNKSTNVGNVGNVNKVGTAWLDCVADADAESVHGVYVWLAARLQRTSRAHVARKGLGDRALRRRIEHLLRTAATAPLVAVLDELDDLLDVPGGAALVQQLCVWAARPHSPLVLVGIGNSMHLVASLAALATATTAHRRPHRGGTLTQRQQQQQQQQPQQQPQNASVSSVTTTASTSASNASDATSNASEQQRQQQQTALMAWLPEVLRFRAYSQGEIAAILGARVGALGVLAPAALQLVAMRAENMGGDLRVAMTMCREPLLRAYMAYARTHALPPLPLPVAHVAPVVAELVDDTRALISGLTALQKQFLAALFAASADAADALTTAATTTSKATATATTPPPLPPHGTPPCAPVTAASLATTAAATATTRKEAESALEAALRQHRLAPASKAAVYACYGALCAALGTRAPSLSMLVLFRECVGALTDLNFVRCVGTDALDLAVDADDLLAALRTTDALVYRALLAHFAPVDAAMTVTDTAGAAGAAIDADAEAALYADF